MEIEDITKDIYTYIKDTMNHSKDFNISAGIVEDGLVDSTAILTLVLFLENKFGVQIDFEDINPDNFSNIGAMARFIKQLVG